MAPVDPDPFRLGGAWDEEPVASVAQPEISPEPHGDWGEALPFVDSVSVGDFGYAPSGTVPSVPPPEGEFTTGLLDVHGGDVESGGVGSQATGRDKGECLWTVNSGCQGGG
jgi:hypothetical protein